MSWLASFWPSMTRPEEPVFALAALAAIAILARCLWTRVWVHLLVLVAYVVIVVAALVQIAARAKGNPYAGGTQHVAYLARRDLPANRRLVDGDVERPGDLPLGFFWSLPTKSAIEGRDLPGKVYARQPIDATSLRVSPTLSPGVRFVAIALAELKQSLNAGATVMLCAADSECLPGVVAVEAIVCTPQETHCYAALAPPDQQQHDALSKAKSPLSMYKTIVPVTLP